MFQQQMIWVFRLFLFCIGLMLISSTPALAYKTTPQKWPGNSLTFSIDPNNDSNLRFFGSINWLENAVGQWRNASAFLLRYNSTFDPTGNIISTKDFKRDPPCRATDLSEAKVCIDETFLGSNVIQRVQTYFNVSASVIWRTDGFMDETQDPRLVDFPTIALHEIGHWYWLDHPCARDRYAVMCDSGDVKRTLTEDDKHGATLMYGPWTSFEWYEARGEYSRPYYGWNVAGYYNTFSPPPELSPVGMEFGIPFTFGSQYERMAGFARESYSYIYFLLFTTFNDLSPDSRAYVTIKPGMRLRWNQYNFQQTTMCVDFEMTDGATLRDSGLTDYRGIRVHPAARMNDPIGQWFSNSVDLTPLQDKTIRHYMIAYDNGNNGITGAFRAYFEDLTLTY